MTTTILSLRELPRKVVGRVRRLGRRVRPSPTILMYHRIAEDDFDPWGLAVSPARFAEQMAWLAANREVLPLATFAKLHKRGELPPHAIAITFDDGYSCNSAIAAPIMRSHNLSGTVFICPTLIKRGEECWWDDLERIILSAPSDSLSLSTSEREHVVQLGQASKTDRIWAADQPARTDRQKAFLTLWACLQKFEPNAQHAAIADLRRQARLPAEPRPSHRLMTSNEVADLAHLGLSIGAHTLTHIALTNWKADLKAAEIVGSRFECADLVGEEPACFAYPYGDFDEEAETIVDGAGFLCACTTENAAVRPSDPIHLLPRLRAGNWTGQELARAFREI